MSNFTDLIETKLDEPLRRVKFKVSGQWGLGKIEYVGAVTNHGKKYHDVIISKYYGYGTSDGISKCGLAKRWSVWWFITQLDVEENSISACRVCFPQSTGGGLS